MVQIRRRVQDRKIFTIRYMFRTRNLAIATLGLVFRGNSMRNIEMPVSLGFTVGLRELSVSLEWVVIMMKIRGPSQRFVCIKQPGTIPTSDSEVIWEKDSMQESDLAKKEKELIQTASGQRKALIFQDKSGIHR